MGDDGFDYDWVVVGSGFGGSVSALRLSEKGYRVCVLEAGRRYEDEDFAKSAWNFRRYVWFPQLGMRGILRFYVFKDIVILAGSGVGGGSLVYANTLYVPPTEFFQADEMARARRLGGDARAPLRGGQADARRHRGAHSRSTPTGCSASWPTTWASPTAVPPSASSSASPARRCPTPTSAARGPSGPAASAAAPAWSAAATTPRTRCARTTSSSPSETGSRSCPSARSSTSGRLGPRTAPRATRSAASARAD